MKVKISTETISSIATDCLIVTYCEDQDTVKGYAKSVDAALEHRISQLIAEKEIRGTFGEVTLLHNWGKIPAKRTLILGLGKEKELTAAKVRDAIGIAARHAQKKGIKNVTFGVSNYYVEKRFWNPVDIVQGVVEGVELGTYTFSGYKKREEQPSVIEEFILVVSGDLEQSAIQAGLERADSAAYATNLARDLVNEPGNKMTPAILAERAREVAHRRNMEVKVLNKAELEELGMGALLGVGQASTNEPKMVVIKYNGAADSKEVLGYVGKGITFDTGGIQVKPDEGMGEMKTDMAGAAAVIAAMDGIGALQPHVNVIAVIPTCENMISGNNLKPADVITSFSGKTIEIVHTDAEGRLILADGVAYAKHQGATKLVDVATLTGSVVSALGHAATGMITNNAEWLEEVKSAARIAGEKVWELPNFEEYQEYIKSEIADIKNDAGRPAGCIQGGIFIGAFAEDTPWVHLDIAGTAVTDKDKGHNPAGATGVAVRMLIQLAIRFGGK
ncbi:leucyl aminopeptidase [Aneurinibacillus aneurinilyticus]|uniref:leucyl aminopeptidase n=1 Tax=Aneurinibacillus aneurinilyticus TaxID=1391 RepID=UPI002E1D7131|nr:leucyl aminopeptidase [Aneurinibacillus aneurinilyticus]MED0669158.1 leucyl aminopeptidase [Aneurinibacillus aneurinilyticus]